MGEKNKNIEISLVMTIYEKSRVTWLDEALESILPQADYIKELIIVQDGPIALELQKALDSWEERWDAINSFTKIIMDKRQGPGAAAQEGLLRAKTEWIARLDSDDISAADRFKLQTEFLLANPHVDALSGYMPEFREGSKNPNKNNKKLFAINYIPLTHKEIAARMSLRSPMVHSISIFRRELALQSGGYGSSQSHEDYLLWLAMRKNGAVFANIPKIMGYCRVDEACYGRRSGVAAIKVEFTFQRTALAAGYISYLEFLRNLILRIPPRFLPPLLLEKFYGLFLRSSPQNL